MRDLLAVMRLENKEGKTRLQEIKDPKNENTQETLRIIDRNDETSKEAEHAAVNTCRVENENESEGRLLKIITV